MNKVYTKEYIRKLAREHARQYDKALIESDWFKGFVKAIDLLTQNKEAL